MRRLRKRGPANFDNFGHKRLAAYIGEVTAWQNHFVTFIEAQADEGENFSDVCERLGDNHQIVHAYDFWIAEGERAEDEARRRVGDNKSPMSDVISMLLRSGNRKRL